MKKVKRKHPKEFKLEAVRQVESGERSMSEIARSLKITPSLLCEWVRKSRNDGNEAFRGSGNRTAAENKIWELEKENEGLRQELEFLKKVSRYFAKSPK
jgi:transposase